MLIRIVIKKKNKQTNKQKTIYRNNNGILVFEMHLLILLLVSRAPLFLKKRDSSLACRLRIPLPFLNIGRLRCITDNYSDLNYIWTGVH